MSTIVTRSVKGSPLTHNEVDANFTNLNTDKYQSGSNVSFGTLAATGVSTFSAGTAAAPAITTTGDTNTGIFFPAADTIAFGEGGTESMRIDSAGNLGVGVTPSPWGSFKGVQGGSVGSFVSNNFGSGNVQTLTANNIYFDGSNYRYIVTASASFYIQNSGQHQWFSMASGTAGATATLLERMRIDSSGNVGIGISTPAYKLDVTGNIGNTGTLINTSTSGEISKSIVATTGNIYHRITNSGGSLLVGNESSAGGTLMVGSSAYSGLLNVTGAFPLAFGTNNTERMRLFSSGGVSIGNTTDPGISNLSVTGTGSFTGGIVGSAIGATTPSTGAFTTLSASGVATFSAGTVSLPAITTTGDTNTGIFFPAADTIAFGEGGAEAMRITSAGMVGIGTTTPNYTPFGNGTVLTILGNAGATPASNSGVLELANAATPAAGNRLGEISFIQVGNLAAPRVSYINSFTSGSGGANGYGGYLSFNTKDDNVASNAERMRIFASGGVSIGNTTDPGATNLSVTGSSTSASFIPSSATVPTNGLYLPAANSVGLATNTTERMRISAAGGLTVGSTVDAGVGNIAVPSGNSFGFIRGSYLATLSKNSGDDGVYLNNANSSYLAFGTNNTERMRILSSGNVGIGVTNPGNKLSLPNANYIAWLNAAGTLESGGINYNANDAITFYNTAERMRIDSSGNVGIGTASPNASAILDAQSTTKGVRMPNMTTTQKNAIASPAAGLMVFDTTLAKLCVYSGAAWQTITSV
jgi:hypothetical protein